GCTASLPSCDARRPPRFAYDSASAATSVFASAKDVFPASAAWSRIDDTRTSTSPITPGSVAPAAALDSAPATTTTGSANGRRSDADARSTLASTRHRWRYADADGAP